VIRLLRDGAEVAATEGKRLEWSVTTPGAYRVEVYAAERDARLLARAVKRFPPSVKTRDILSPEKILVRAVTKRRDRGPSTVDDLLRIRRQDLRPWIFSNPIYVRQ
jgi:hypothetical protein